MKKHFILIILAGFVLSAEAAQADELTGYGKVSSIDGGKTIQVKRGENSREVARGEELHPGDKIITQKNETVAVSCPDGTVLIVGGSGELKVTESKDAQRASELLKGTIRAIVSKVSKEPQVKPKKFRFIIKTSVATLGVRGTDFIVSANADTATSEFHTLEGTVEIAKDEKTLVTTGGEKVVGGEEVKATAEKVEAPQVFDRAVYADQMRVEQPGLEVPATEPKREAAPAPSPSPSPSVSPSSGPTVSPVEPPVAERKAPKEVDNEPSRTSITSMDFAFWTANGDGNANLKTVQVNWDPTLQLFTHWLALRGQLGLGHFASSSYFEHSATFETVGIALSLRIFGRILVEFGPQHESWAGYGSFTDPQILLGLNFKPGEIWKLDRLYFSFSGGDKPEFYKDRVSGFFNNQNGGSCQGNSNCSSNNDYSSLKVIRLGIGFRF